MAVIPPDIKTPYAVCDYLISDVTKEKWNEFAEDILKLSNEDLADLSGIGNEREKKSLMLQKWENSLPNANVKMLLEGYKKFKEKCTQSTQKDGNRLKGSGKVLALVNDFNGERAGAKMDVKNVNTLWGQFGIEPLVKENLNASEMLDQIEEFRKIRTEAKPKYMVLIISSHGGMIGGKAIEADQNGRTIVENTEQQSKTAKVYTSENVAGSNMTEKEEVIWGNDNHSFLKVEEILELFHNDNAKQLISIPKLLIFQFCRGKKVTVAIPASSDVHIDAVPFEVETEQVQFSVPKISEMIVVYPTHRDFASFRDSETGSWLLTALKKVFLNNWKNEHVVDLLTMVNAEMSQKTGNYSDEEKGRVKVQGMSKFESSLTKKLYLFQKIPK